MPYLIDGNSTACRWRCASLPPPSPPPYNLDEAMSADIAEYELPRPHHVHRPGEGDAPAFVVHTLEGPEILGTLASAMLGRRITLASAMAMVATHWKVVIRELRGLFPNKNTGRMSKRARKHPEFVDFREQELRLRLCQSRKKRRARWAASLASRIYQYETVTRPAIERMRQGSGNDAQIAEDVRIVSVMLNQALSGPGGARARALYLGNQSRATLVDANSFEVVRELAGTRMSLPTKSFTLRATAMANTALCLRPDCTRAAPPCSLGARPEAGLLRRTTGVH